MSTNKDDCAFPAGKEIHTESGLTKREIFAAMAMQGIISGDINKSSSIEGVSKVSCAFADALIAELNKGQE